MTRASSLGRLDHPVLIYVPRPAAPAPADAPLPARERAACAALLGLLTAASTGVLVWFALA